MLLGHVEIPTEEIGDLWTIEEVVYGNGKQSIVMELPFAGSEGNNETWIAEWTKPTEEQWQAFLKQADDPVTLIGKAFVRKATRQIDEGIKWRVYQRDNYTCVYCGTTGVPMTVDHYHPQALGGQTTMENLRACCRRCNKLKANQPIDAWVQLAAERGLNSGRAVSQ